ncbi:hypothetical protein [Maridesulfovibrio ferrireducens]|uniref:hypothetical protein n=1 Tax=Maridesulfovibrio ferrireducens TaxID=246191 RepID=UPI001A27E417|nr:hypothetical protein [Maridesulfovibrio ferrireducens]MBI9113268.1 hypothetical protein [Maridesulfovibrio ferrireducens]
MSIQLNKFGIITLIAFCSFLGGLVGGGVVQLCTGTSYANSVPKLQNATIDVLFANEVITRNISSESFDVINSRYNIVGAIFANNANGATIELGVPDSDTFGIKKRMRIASSNHSGVISFWDEDDDSRLDIEVTNRDPSIAFYYNNKIRLSLGTNNVVTKNTGDDHKIKGSVYTFDKRGDVTGVVPR